MVHLTGVSRFLVVAIFLAGVIAGCVSSPPPGPTPASRLPTPTVSTIAPTTPQTPPAGKLVSVELRGFSFSPSTITIRPGDVVVWTNRDEVPHTVTADDGGWDSDAIGPTETFQRAFATPGTFSYHCVPHPSMTGKVIVAPGSGPVEGPSPPAGGVPTPTTPTARNDPEPVDPKKIVLPTAPILPMERSDTGPDDWPRYGHDAWNTNDAGVAGSLSATTATNLHLLWNKTVPGGVGGTPIVVNDTVYVWTMKQWVYAFDAATGSEKWRTQVNKTWGATGSPTYADGTIYVMSLFNATVHALDAKTGKRLWSTAIEPYAQGWSSPVVYRGFVIVANAGEEFRTESPSRRGSISALNASTGVQVWRTYVVPPGFDGAGILPTPALYGDLVIFGTGNAYSGEAHPNTDAVIAVKLTTGEIAWSTQVTPEDTLGVGPDRDFVGSPQIANIRGHAVLVISQKRMLHALDPSNGELIWSTELIDFKDANVIGTGAVHGEHWYFHSGQTAIWNVNIITRAVEWKAPGGTSFSAAAFVNGLVIVTETTGYNGNGTLRILAAATGASLFDYRLPGSTFSGPSTSHDRVFVGYHEKYPPATNLDGGIVALGT